ncbi:MAG: hypothetical protein HGGPFJEG_00444 [Ignavibacteria bacterium]|nr:hypothetical protein [Ignavibacteria bacterium]
METDILHKLIESAALAIEILAVIFITCAIFYNVIKAAINFSKRSPEFFRKYKDNIGRSLQASLEFLVAADIIRTVIIEPTVQSVIILCALVLIRTFLSWSIIIESENRLPWKPKYETDSDTFKN